MDIGGTNIRIAVVKDSEVLEVKQIKSCNNYNDDLSKIFNIIKSFEIKDLKGIGISIAGKLKDDFETMFYSYHLMDWNEKNIVSDFKKEFNCPIKLNNDALCAALGEYFYGKNKGKKFLFFIWGTGFGGVEVRKFNDKILVSGFEPGNQIVNNNYFEDQIGGGHLRAFFKKDILDLTKNDWQKIVEIVSSGIINILCVRPNNDRIIFSGGVILNNENIIFDIKKEVNNKIRGIVAPNIIEISGLKYPGILGSLVFFENEIFYD